MKKWMIFMLIVFWACGEKGDEFGSPDQLLLLSDREVVCAGQTATLRIFSTYKRSEIPISEFDFDPLPSGIESISSSGLLNVGAITASSEVTISGTYKGKTKLSTKLKIQPASSSVLPSLVVSPFGFFNRDGGAPHYFWPDGSVILGSEIYGPESLKKFEVKKYSNQGVLVWKKDLGSGEAKFIQIQNDKIFAAGKLNEIGGAIFFVVFVLDFDGNVIFEKKIPSTPRQVFFGFIADDRGNFYLSAYSDGDSYVTSLTKFNSLGEKQWEIQPEQALKEIFVFPDGNFAGKSIEGLGLVPYLNFFGSNGNAFGKVRIYQSGVFFKGPNNTLGIGGSSSYHGTFLCSFNLFNSVGQEIVNKKIEVSWKNGAPENPVEKRQYSNDASGIFITDQSGEIHVLHSAFYGFYDFLNLNSSSGRGWIWWKENKKRVSEGVLYPLQIFEEGDKFILLANSDGKLYRFTLGKDYSFDDCLREPFWNKLDLF